MMACCSLISCNDIEKQADVKLQEAKTAFQQGNYDLAKQLIDSIKVLYPKAFDTRVGVAGEATGHCQNAGSVCFGKGC